MTDRCVKQLARVAVVNDDDEDPVDAKTTPRDVVVDDGVVDDVVVDDIVATVPKTADQGQTVDGLSKKDVAWTDRSDTRRCTSAPETT